MNPMIAQQTAKMLLEVEAISIRPQQPFTLTSGKLSPVYVDCRKLIAFPRLRRRLMDFALQVIESEIGFESIDVVAGGESAGIPYAAWIADLMMLPMLYIRKKPKGFGHNARIEGCFTKGHRALLVEDLATDGGSKLNFCLAMREAGLTVNHTFVIFYYGVNNTLSTLMQQNINMHWLTSWEDILAECRSSQRFSSTVLLSIEHFLSDPIQWDAHHRETHSHT